MPHLLIQNGDGGPQQIELQGDRITVGRRPDNDLVLGNDSVSSHHAEIVRQDGTSRVRDLGSSNGTKLNGEAVHEVPLKDGDKISFGPVETKFIQGDATQKQAHERPSAKEGLRDLGARIAETSRALWGEAKRVARLAALKTKIEKLKLMLVLVGGFIGFKKRATRSQTFSGTFSGQGKMITPSPAPGISIPTHPANPAADAKNRHPGLSGKGDPQPLTDWDAKSVMQDILRHLAKGRRDGLHAKDWTWQEINVEEIYSNCTGTPFALKLVAKQLADHIGLICTDFDVQFVASSPNNAPAYVELAESCEGVTAFINIRYEVMEDDRALAAIIAHEICHALLLVIDYPSKRSERATDLCAIALGLGPLIRDGKTEGRNLGYLSAGEIRQAMTVARALKGSV